MMLPAFVRRLSPERMVAAAFALLAGSGTLLWMHAAAVRDMREVGLPAALALPRIERRMEILREQNEIAELQAALRGGSEEERLRVYVLPEQDDIDRLLAAFDVLFAHLERTRALSSVPGGVRVGERMSASGSLSALPVSFEAVVTREGLGDLLLFAELSGLLTVSDAFSPDEIDALLAFTEQGNPVSVAALEHFLATDLLRYSEEPGSFEEQLRASFPPAAADELHGLIDQPRLRRARTLLGDMASVLQRQHLWPLRLLTAERVVLNERENGLIHAEFLFHSYVRAD